MIAPPIRPAARRSQRWLLVLLAPVVVLGIVAMHSLLAPAAPTAVPAAAVMAHGTGTQEPAHATPALGDTGHEGGMVGDMTDCGGLMVMCLALLTAVVGWVLWRRRLLLRVLWERPASTTLRLGTVRQPFHLLTPLQRTTVLRC